MNFRYIYIVLLLISCHCSAQEMKDTLSFQQFKGYDHELKGSALLYKDSLGNVLLDLVDMRMTEAPDAKLYLTKTDTYHKSKALKLADLKSIFDEETTTYTLPKDIDLSSYKNVIIWCYQYNVLFGNAPIILKK